MDKSKLVPHVPGTLTVKVADVAWLARIAHSLRQEIGDPRLPGRARANYAEMIQAVDILVMNAGDPGED